jgi:hypothetical protein
MLGGTPLNPSGRQLLVSFPVVRSEDSAPVRHEIVVAVHRFLDERNAPRVSSLEKHSTGGQARV